jgi:hypothetical protein
MRGLRRRCSCCCHCRARLPQARLAGRHLCGNRLLVAVVTGGVVAAAVGGATADTAVTIQRPPCRRLGWQSAAGRRGRCGGGSDSGPPAALPAAPAVPPRCRRRAADLPRRRLARRLQRRRCGPRVAARRFWWCVLTCLRSAARTVRLNASARSLLPLCPPHLLLQRGGPLARVHGERGRQQRLRMWCVPQLQQQGWRRSKARA